MGGYGRDRKTRQIIAHADEKKPSPALRQAKIWRVELPNVEVVPLAFEIADHCLQITTTPESGQVRHIFTDYNLWSIHSHVFDEHLVELSAMAGQTNLGSRGRKILARKSTQQNLRLRKALHR